MTTERLQILTLQENTDKQQKIDEAMDKLEDYTTVNRLILNRDKTKFLVFTKNPLTRQKLHLKAQPKNIKPIRKFKFLGMQISDNLDWSTHLLEGKLSLKAQLHRRLGALKNQKSS